MSDERANILKVQNLHGRHRCKCGRHKRESGSVISGEVLKFPKRVSPWECGETNFKESADAIVAQDQERRAELVIREGKKNFETCRSWRRRKKGWEAFAQATKADGIGRECQGVCQANRD